MIDFKCTRCGNCCSNLISSFNGLLVGLYLNPEEVKWFPEDKVVPLFFLDKEVVAYQVNSNVCPQLYFENRLSCCKIYENRPLGCRAFPLKGLNTLDKQLCAFTSQHADINIESFVDEKDAILQQIKESNIIPTGINTLNK